MPIYEYRCSACGRKSSVFLRSFSDDHSPTCTFCGSPELKRMVSLFSVIKSEESRLDDLADPSRFGDLDENDPRSMARWARKMGSELGDDLGPEFDEMVERMEAGESPEELEAGDDDPL